MPIAGSPGPPADNPPKIDTPIDFWLQKRDLARCTGMTPQLLELSASLLASPTTPPPLRRVAGKAILTAVEEDIALPIETMRLTWNWLIAEPGLFHGSEAFAALDDEPIRSSALALLVATVTERCALHLVEAVLSGSGHAHRLDDRTLMSLVEHATTSPRAETVAAILTAVQAARGLPADFRRAVRDRWAAGDAFMREVSVEIAFLEDDIDTAFVDRLLCDPAQQVRLAIADTLRKQSLFDRDTAFAVDLAEAVLSSARQRARCEPDREVRGALYRAISSMEYAEDDAARERQAACGGCDPQSVVEIFG